MKNICLSALLFFSLDLAAQNNWDIFPLNQKTWWQVGDSLQVYYNDSTEVGPLGSTHYFGKKYIEGYFGDCFFTLWLDLYEDGFETPENYFWTWETSGTAWGFNGETYFYPQCSVGDSWSFSIENNSEFSDVVISCTGMDTIDVLGLSTPVKYFSMVPMQNSVPVQNELNNIELILSEKAGFLRFIPFQLLVQGQIGPVYEISGFEKDGQTFGFIPSWESYFGHYAPGDLLKWKKYEMAYSMNTMYITSWIRDSLTAVNFTSEQLILQSVREVYKETTTGGGNPPVTNYSINPNYVQTFDRDYFQIFWNGVPKWFGGGQGSSAALLNAWVDTAGFQRIEADYKYYFNVTDCFYGMPYDYSIRLTMDQYCGLVSKNENLKNYNSYEDLIGCASNGHTWGDLSSPLSAVSTHSLSDSQLALYPTVTNSNVCMSIPDGIRPQAFLIDAYGRQTVLPAFDSDPDCIDVTGLPAGLYNIVLYHNAKYWTGRFVKI